MASLIRRKSGIYYVQFYDEARTPSRKQRSLGTKEKSLARAKLARWERAWQLGETDPWTEDFRLKPSPESSPPDPSLEEALESFLRSRREMNATSETLRTYREVLSPFLRSKRGTPSSLTGEELRAFVHADGLAAATSEKRYRVLRTFLGFFGEEDSLAPIGKPKLDSRRPVGVRPDELKAICAEIKSDYRRLRRKGHIPPGRLVWRINAYWCSLLTGLRRSEIARLRWRDVDLGKGLITLREQKSRREEVLPISEKAASLLSRLPHRTPRALGHCRSQREGWVFRSPYGRASGPPARSRGWANRLSRTFAKYRDKAGVREELDFHALRKGFCSELARKGASAMTIKRLARHASIETSLRYIEPDDSAARAVLDGLF